MPWSALFNAILHPNGRKQQSSQKHKSNLVLEELEIRNMLDGGLGAGYYPVAYDPYNQGPQTTILTSPSLTATKALPTFAEITKISPDNGISDSDHLTNSGDLSIEGIGAAGATLQLSIDGHAAGTTTVDSNGKWSITPATLAQGNHYLTVLQNGISQDMTQVTIDLTTPEVTLQAPEFSKSSTFNVSVSLKSGDNFGLDSKVFVDVDLNGDGKIEGDQEIGYASGFAFEGTLSVTVANVPEGIYQIRARLSDRAGNTGLSATAVVQVDPNAGHIGSSVLLNLLSEYKQAKIAESSPTTLYGSTGYFDPMGTYYPSSPTMNPGQGSIAAKTVANVLADYDQLMFDTQERVNVSIRATLTKNLERFKGVLEDMGMAVTGVTPAQNLVTGYFPIAKLKDLEGLEDFSAVVPIIRPLLATGLVDGQGDPIIKADVFRVTPGATGSGVKVGILSDSVSKVGNGLSDSQSTSDLPSNVQVLQDFDGSNPTDEGRAMLEIVADVAPNAALAFHTAFISPQSFADGIKALATAGATVIADDVSYADEPMFNDGIITQATDTVAGNGVFYATSAGNQGNVGWQSDWTGASNQTIGSGNTAVTGTFFTFGNNDILQNITLNKGDKIRITFQWDSAFLEGGSNLSNFQVANNLDVYLTSSDGSTILASSKDDNANTDEAVEFLDFTNNSDTDTNFALAFQLASGTDPNKIRWVNFGGADPKAQDQGAPTVFGHAAGKNAVAVGAVPWFDPDTPEGFSALGGLLQIDFDANGNRLNTPEFRNKPDMTAPDGVNTTFFGQDISADTDSFPNFFGTSAAAPSLAAGVALLISQAKASSFTPTPSELLAHIQNTAKDLGTTGFDFKTGAGLLQLVALPIPTPPPTPVPPVPPVPPVVLNPESDDNDTSDKASSEGTLFTGTSSLSGLSIARHSDGTDDYDWYKFTAGTGGTLQVSIKNIQTLSGGDLHVRLFKLVNGSLVEIGSSTKTGRVTEQDATATISEGDVIFIYVFGYNFEQGNYDMDIKLN